MGWESWGEEVGGGGVSHSEVVQDPAAGEEWAPPLPRVGGHGLLHPGGERMGVDWALTFVFLTEFSEGPVSSPVAGQTCPPWTLVSPAPGRCSGRKHQVPRVHIRILTKDNLAIGGPRPPASRRLSLTSVCFSVKWV